MENIMQFQSEYLDAIKRIWQKRLDIYELLNLAEKIENNNNYELAAALYKLWLLKNDTNQNHFVYYNLSVVSLKMGELNDALSAAKKAIELYPSFILPHLTLLQIYNSLSMKNEKIAECLWITENVSPVQKEFQDFLVCALNTVAEKAEENKEYAKAYEYCSRSLSIKEDQPDVLHHWIFLREKLCIWPVLSSFGSISSEKQKRFSSAMAILSITDDPELQFETAVNFAKKICLPEILLSQKRKYNHNKIRIGYCSSNYCIHPVGMLTVELFEQHNRDLFEIYGFCWTNEGDSELRTRIAKSFEHFYKIGQLSDEESAGLIKEREIDIVIDLHGQTLGARPGIFAFRPAPVQITYLGLPGTTGYSFIDYVIADQYIIPNEFQHYFSEKPIYMPDCFQVSDRKRVPYPTPSKYSQGLPETGFIFCSFNSSFKITPEIFTIWMNILKRVPDSVLWLISDNTATEENLKKEAQKQKVSVERLIFSNLVSPPEYLARMKLADLFLDTYPFNAGTTANDSLWMGLPVLTLSGRSFASRMAGSLLKTLNLHELITKNYQDYEEKAITLAHDPEKCFKIRNHLKTECKNGVLFDTPRFVKNLENIFLKLITELPC
ncbi:MAG: acetylglucosamine transferase [Candidatus Riflebacteria bacterium]|nr:acetylglucosamine transferase [Candidatus Riflebacteria bacterium]